MKICNRKTFLFFLSLFLRFSDISAAKKWQILGLALLKILNRDRSRVWNFHYVSGNRRAECKLRIGKRDERVANYGKSLIRWGANFSIREGWSFRFGQSNRSGWNISIIIAIFVSIDSKIGLESLAPFKNEMKIDEGKEGKEAKLTIRYSFSNLDRYFLVRRTGLGFLLRMEYQTEQYRASTFFLHTACKITRNDTYTLAWKYEWNLSPRRLETRYRSICQGQPPRKRRGARRAGTASTTSCPLFSSRIRTAPAGACQQLGQQVDARSTIARASLAESEWRDSHVRPVPLRLSWNVATTTTTAIFAPPIVLHDCETGTTVYNEFDRRYIVSLLSFIVGWVSKRAGKFIFGREMRKAANPVGQTTANWTATGGRLRFSIGFDDGRPSPDARPPPWIAYA